MDEGRGMRILEEARLTKAAHDGANPDEEDRTEWWMPQSTLDRFAVEERLVSPVTLLGRPIHIDDSLGGLVLARLKDTA